ncbi:MAG TPA: hypothetical protein VGB85_07400 [Nannocystis sp.]|jgi:hypothetical protein
MSSRSTLLLLALPLACAAPAPADDSDSSSASGTTTDAPTTAATSTGDGPETTGEPPPDTALLVHSFGAYDLAALEETEPCAQWTFNNEQPLYVNTVTLSNDGGYHHSNWLVVPETSFVGEDGFFDCYDRGFHELLAAVAGTVLFAQSTQSRYETQELPAGVVVKVPPRHKLIAGVHLLNLSTAPTRSELRMGLEIVHPRDVQTIVSPFRLSYEDLAIPALSESRFTGECLLDTQYAAKSGAAFDIKLYHVLPHYHYLGNYFSVEILGGPRDGEQIYLHTGFNADGNGRTYDPPIDLTGARGLRFTCGYDNWRDKPIGYGIGDQEMCDMLALADMRVMMNGAVDSGNKLVGADGDVLLHTAPCNAIALPKNASQGMPSAAERDAPLYIPPTADGDVDLDPVRPCIDTPADAAPAGPATLTNLRETVFGPACSFSSCHGGKTPAAVRLDGVDLHALLLGPSAAPGIRLVTPGNPDDSWLYRLLSQCEPRDADGNLHTHMPYNAPNLLDPRLVATVRAWIEAGAPPI